MIHPNLVVKRFTFIYWHFVCFLAISSNVHPGPSTKPRKLKIKLLFPKMVIHPSLAKFRGILSKCDNVIENIEIHMSWEVFFLVWNFAQMWKINMKREYLIICFFGRKQSLDLQKIENHQNHVVTFLYWFWFGNNFLNV